MSDYTKGPWHYKPNANGVYGADGYAITYPIEQAITVLGSDDHSNQWIKRNVAANARLIAAAPELLEALDNTQQMLERLGLESSDEYQANASSIAKAKGE